jgi:prepilin-type N-terminal cleavage/methylation domain-containing protein
MLIKFRPKRGMTLVEIIIAIAIMGIIFIAFSSTFMAGILGIIRAGDKGLAYNLAQEDLETQIARGDSVLSDPLVLEFEGYEVTIIGGSVDVEKYSGKINSKIEAFIPLVPTISIIPSNVIEGVVLPVEIEITGINTNFSVSSTVQIVDRNNSVVTFVNAPTLSVINKKKAILTINQDLYNHLSDYNIRIITPILNKPTEYVRAQYSIGMPQMVAVSLSSIFTSDSGLHWTNRSAELSFPANSSNLKGVAFANDKYVVVGSAGKILIGEQNKNWISNTHISGEDFNDITWSSYHKKFYMVSEQGSIYSSNDGIGWDNLYTVSNPLKGIEITTNGKIISVGSGGTIAFSNDGITWDTRNLGPKNFNKVIAYDNSAFSFYVAVGDSGVISVSNGDFTVWNSSVSNTSFNLNDIVYYVNKIGSVEKLICVGNQGTILESVDYGATWTHSNSGVTNDLFGSYVLRETDHIIVVGSSIVLRANELLNWSPVIGVPSYEFNSISGK